MQREEKYIRDPRLYPNTTAFYRRKKTLNSRWVDAPSEKFTMTTRSMRVRRLAINRLIERFNFQGWCELNEVERNHIRYEMRPCFHAFNEWRYDFDRRQKEL